MGTIKHKHRHSKLTLLIILELEIKSNRIMIFGLVVTQSLNFTDQLQTKLNKDPQLIKKPMKKT